VACKQNYLLLSSALFLYRYDNGMFLVVSSECTMFEQHYRLKRLLSAVFGTKHDVCNTVTLGNQVLNRIHIRMVLWK